ncbi:MAG: class I SAM-dependent methyltransferase [Anaerolineales bacterium]|jgi:ubiquinone/menaquinone biosynthesis C-methylase UbiE
MRRIVEAFMRFFFKHLYTTFAWTYDLVAWTTSMGQWRTWQQAAFIAFEPGLLLELGHGPGHLLLDFSDAGYRIFGVDASLQMSRLASRKIKAASLPNRVIRASALALPLKSSSFSGAVATFPSEYILQQETMQSIHRVLTPQGKFVVIGLQSITGQALYDRLASWLYRITGQADHPEDSYQAWLNQLRDLGFDARIEIVEQKRAKVLRVVARKM